jgi:hypothetical protein
MDIQKIASYLDFRSNPSNDETTDGMWCGQNQFSILELADWKSKEPKWAQHVLEQRRTRYAEQLSAVDAALIEKAKGGDTKAAELLYRRFENWTPKAADEALKRNPTQKTFAELIEEGGEV